MEALGRTDPERAAACARYLAAVQRPDGAFPTWPGGPADASVTRLVALALRGSGGAGHATGARAGAWLRAQNDLPPEDDLVKIHRAALGELDWGELPYVTPRLVSLPDWVHPNLYDLSFMRFAGVTLAVRGSGAIERDAADAGGNIDCGKMGELGHFAI